MEKLRVFQDSPAVDQAPLSGNIQFYVTPITANIFIVLNIQPFLKAHPQVSVRLREVVLSEFLEQLPELLFDAAIIHVPLNRLSMLPQDYLAEFSFETIYSSKLATLCHKSHPLADKRTISWKMAREYPFFTVNEHNLEDFALSELVEKYGEPSNLTLLSNFNLCLDGLFGNPQALAISLANSQQFIDHPKRQELRSISLRENIPMAVLIFQRRNETIPEAVQIYLDGLRVFIQKNTKAEQGGFPMKLTVLVDNNTYIDQYYCGEPAAAYYIEDGDKRILWDCGYSDIILRNAQALGIDLGRLTDIAISHGHDDHTRGLRALTTAYDLSAVTLTAYPLAFDPKRTADGQLIGSPFTASELAQRCQLRLSAEPVKLSPRLTFLGQIPRVFPFEARAPIGQHQTAGGWTDDWLTDDTALVYESPAGLYIITACSHSGICNICQYAQTVTGQTRILGIIGGFHLFGITPQLTATIDYFKKLDITDLYPCHCVDFAARAAIHEQLPITEVGVGLTLEW